MNKTRYTAEELRNMTVEETELILKNMPKFELPPKEILKLMDVGIYDKDGHLIGEKPGGEY
ncbi:MAG: hypothetical protein IJ682_03620 [Lachnospiraceae bacterium]|nr:hypothetical protein [Lachnospiraceae bacterium]